MEKTMPASSDLPRIFISYAGDDGLNFARNLHKLLTGEGLNVWWDKTRMEGGKGWWDQIVKALTGKQIEYLVIVMTPGAMQSELVREEWQLARQEGVCVVPVIASHDLDYNILPKWMSAAHFVNPDDPDQWKRFIRTLETPCQKMKVPIMAKKPPEDFVQRSREFNRIKSDLLSTQSEPIAITAVLQGAGGFGKTTLAKAICHDEHIQEEFYDGILWVTLGEQPGNLIGRIRDLIYTLNHEHYDFETLDAAVAHLRELLAKRQVLMVIDDVWNGAHLSPFLEVGCAHLFTTRDSGTLPSNSIKITVDAMQPSEAVDLLKTHLPSGDEDRLCKLASDLGEWPLLLKLINGVLLQQMNLGMGVDKAIDYVTQGLAQVGLTAFDPDNPQSRDQAVAATLEVSFRQLSEDERARYRELAIFPEDVDIPLIALERLWSRTGNLSSFHMKRLCAKLYRLSLLHDYNTEKDTIQLHDVMRKYLMEVHREELPSIHNEFLDGFGVVTWPDLPADEFYLWKYLAYHMIQAGRKKTLHDLLLDFKWLQSRLEITGVNSLISDYDFLPDNEPLSLVQGAIRLSTLVLTRDHTQLAGQLLGRLLNFDEPKIQLLLNRARKGKEYTELLPLTSSLTPPGGPLLCTLEGHTDWVNAVAVTPDGSRIVSASNDDTIKVWDMESGRQLNTLEGHTDQVRAVAVTPDSSRIVSASDDCTIKVWDMESGRQINTLEGHTDLVNMVAVTPDGSRIVSASDDGTIKVWDMENGQLINTLEGHTSCVKAVAVKSDGSSIVSASNDGTIKVWDMENGQLINTLECHIGWISAVAVTPDGSFIVSASDDGTIKVWDMESGQLINTLEGHIEWISAVAMTPDGSRVVSASDNGTIKVWDMESGQQINTLEGHTSWVRMVAVTPDGNYVLSASSDGTVKVWDMESGRLINTLEDQIFSFRAVKIKPDGIRVVSASDDGTVKVRDMESGRLINTLEGHKDQIEAVAVTPDGSRVISASKDCTIKVWDMESGRLINTLEGHTISINAVIVTPDGSCVVSASNDGTIKVWDVESGRLINTLEDLTHLVSTMTVTPDGSCVVSGSYDGVLKVWDVESGRLINTLEGHTRQVSMVEVTPDGSRVVSASGDGTLKVWDMESGRLINTLEGHTEWVSAMAVTPDSSRAVSASDDRTVKVWNIERGEIITTFTGESPMTSCTVSPDGLTIITGDASGKVHFLRLKEKEH